VGCALVEQLPEFAQAPSITGISVFQRRDGALATVRQKAEETARLLEQDVADLEGRIVVYDDYLGEGYGVPTDAMLEAVTLAARLEGLLVDPVYTGKTLSGLIDMVRQGRFAANDNIVFWHTGGTPALFAYRAAFEGMPAGESTVESVR
jgi:1-aminocyclopropane-1-carboxylate deaminase/D-cysteine desulfhydrase-like pyridoxal-dependent ACC family enzyme